MQLLKNCNRASLHSHIITATKSIRLVCTNKHGTLAQLETHHFLQGAKKMPVVVHCLAPNATAESHWSTQQLLPPSDEHFLAGIHKNHTKILGRLISIESQVKIEMSSEQQRNTIVHWLQTEILSSTLFSAHKVPQPMKPIPKIKYSTIHGTSSLNTPLQSSVQTHLLHKLATNRVGHLLLEGLLGLVFFANLLQLLFVLFFLSTEDLRRGHLL